LIHANNGAVTIADKKQINNPIYTFDELEALAKDCSTKERVAES
jgi:hypothetical protein